MSDPVTTSTVSVPYFSPFQWLGLWDEPADCVTGLVQPNDNPVIAVGAGEFSDDFNADFRT